LLYIALVVEVINEILLKAFLTFATEDDYFFSGALISI
jgi:hypothetical protein